MPATSAVVSTITPKARAGLVKYVTVARTDTTAFAAVGLPKGAYITGVYVLGSAASNAATTGTVTAGFTAGGTELVNAFNVKTNGVGYHVAGATTSVAGTQLTTDKTVYAVYAETGTASTTGGPWTIKVEYTLPGSGEAL